MSNEFSSGKNSVGFCDRCGFRFLLSELSFQVVAQKETALSVCSVCMDIDQEQLLVGKFPVSDPQAVRNARPDPSMESSRELADQVALSTLFVPTT